MKLTVRLWVTFFVQCGHTSLPLCGHPDFITFPSSFLHLPSGKKNHLRDDIPLANSDKHISIHVLK